jgi:1-acyl-sn-glycerol-3-phosphate acyltransferase
MVVGNHSGYGVMEIFVLLSVWTRRHGTNRPVVGLSHDVGMKWALRWGVSRIGGARASRKVAQDALSRGFDVLVFPGGDVDALRPFSARYQVQWGGRAGFVRTAADAGVPIVPMANCGSHAQFTLLGGGPAIARLIGLTRFRINTWPVPIGSFALLGTALGWALGGLSPWWMIAGLLCAFFPNPTRMQIRFLRPIDARELLSAHGGDEAAAAESLRTHLECTLGALARERKTAWG